MIEVLSIWLLVCLCLLSSSSVANARDTESLVPKHRFELGLGLAYHLQGDLERAIAEYNNAIELDPGLASAYYNLACAYAMIEDSDAAINWLDKAIEMEESFRDLAKNDADFDSIRHLPSFQSMLEGN